LDKLSLKIDVDADRTMIRSSYVRQNKGLVYFVDQRFTGQHIINPPTDVFGPGTCAKTPPTVCCGIRMKMPKGIDQPRIQEPAKTVNFGLGITGRLIIIRLRTGDIDFPVRNIEIATGAGSPYFCESSFWASKPKFAAKA